MNPFYVKVNKAEKGWFMQFHYNTDCRFEATVPIIDTVAIHNWCIGRSYKSELINF